MTFPTFIVGTRGGGIGKTLLSHLTYLGHLDAGIGLKLAAADTAGDGTETSKLGKLFPGQVQELGIGASLEETRREAAAAVSYWDALGSLLLCGGTVVDLGANVVPTLLAWAKTRDAGRILRRRNAPPIVLVVPAKPQAQSIEDALSLLEQSLSLQDVLPVSSRVLVLNEVGGSFGAYGTDKDIERLQGMKLSHGVRAARLRQCTSELWPIIERRHMRLDEVLALEPEEIADRFGLSLFAASGAQVDLIRWLNESLDSLRAVGVMPPAAIASVATSRAAG